MNNFRNKRIVDLPVQLESAYGYPMEIHRGYLEAWLQMEAERIESLKPMKTPRFPTSGTGTIDMETAKRIWPKAKIVESPNRKPKEEESHETLD